MKKRGRFVANLSESESTSDSDDEALSMSPEATEDSKDSDSTPSEASANVGSSEEGSCRSRKRCQRGKGQCMLRVRKQGNGGKRGSLKNRK